MDERYEFIDTKSVLDYDGFLTDYTMYLDTETGEYIFIFGDNDYYGPDTDSVDHECESLEEAYEWFNDYDGAAGELEEVDECQSIGASSEEGNGYDDYLFELKGNIHKKCFHQRAKLHVVSDDIETIARQYEDLSTHYTELKDDVASIYDVVSKLDAIRDQLGSIGDTSSVKVESSTYVKSSTYDEEDFDGTDLESDLIIMKQELEKVYFRLGHLQDKWFDTELSYELNDAASQVGKAFTTIRTALLVYGKQ